MPANRRARTVTTTVTAVSVLLLGTLGVGIAHAAASGSSPWGGDAGGCSVASMVDSWSAGTLQVQARSVNTGKVLLDRGGNVGAETGSNLKVLTMSAALAALGPETRIPTRVVEGATPDTIVLIGGGDPTLSRLPSGQESVYPGAPHLDALADQVLKARAKDPALARVPIRHLKVDSSLFSGPAWQPSWSLTDRNGGSVSNITALMVDGDRDDPTQPYSRRGDGAVSRAAVSFARLLGSKVAIDPSLVVAPTAAKSLAAVQSATVAELVRYTLTHSDDTLAETLGRLVSIREGTGNRFSSVQAGLVKALSIYGIPTDAIKVVDASGLSHENRVTPEYFSQLLVLVAQKQKGLAPVYDGLAVAGETGTLAEDGRFSQHDLAARGHIRAKTGTLSDMFGLTGITDEVHGTQISFTIWAEGTSDKIVRSKIDALASAIWSCGGNLTDR